MGEVNWGHGRLQPYESLISVFAKFCELNCISPSEFRALLRQIFAEPKWTASKGLTSDQEELLAGLLDEPIEMVKTITPRDFQLPSPFCIRSDTNARNYAYCPVCLERGYHASFHELPWLRKCAIHQVDLFHIPTAWPKGGESSDDAYVRGLISLYRQANSRWLVCVEQTSLWPNRKVGVFAEIRGWMATVRAAVGMGEVMCGVHFVGGGNYDQTNLGALLERLHWLSPLSADAIDCLAMQPGPIEVNQIVLSKEDSSELQRILSLAPLNDLIWFYKKTSLIYQDPLITDALSVALDRVSGRNHKCRCEWGWSRYSGWTRVPEDVWPSATYICPHAKAQRELQSGWAISDSDNGQPDQRDWEDYLRMAARLIDKGIAAPLDGGQYLDPRQIPIGTPCVRFILGTPTVKALRNIALSELDVRSTEVTHWLSLLHRRAPPPSIRNTPASILVYCRSCSLVVLKWPPATRTR